jgi:hypothetical protein
MPQTEIEDHLAEKKDVNGLFVGQHIGADRSGRPVATVIGVNIDVNGQRPVSSSCYIHEFPLIRRRYLHLNGDVKIQPYWAPRLPRARQLTKVMLDQEYKRLEETYVIRTENGKRLLLEEVYGLGNGTRLFQAIDGIARRYAELRQVAKAEERDLRLDEIMSMVEIADPAQSAGGTLVIPSDMTVVDEDLGIEKATAPDVEGRAAFVGSTPNTWEDLQAFLAAGGQNPATAEGFGNVLAERFGSPQSIVITDFALSDDDWALVPNVGKHKGKRASLVRMLEDYLEDAIERTTED